MESTVGIAVPVSTVASDIYPRGDWHFPFANLGGTIESRAATAGSRPSLLRYDNENGWKGGLDYGWIADGDGGFGVSLAWDAEFHTDPQGLFVTPFTQDTFSLTAESGGGGNNWSGLEYLAKSKSEQHTSENGTTVDSLYRSRTDEDVRSESADSSQLNLSISKATGGDPTGGATFMFQGSASDHTRVRDSSEGDYDMRRDDGSGTISVNEGDSRSRYDLDDDYQMIYSGSGGVTFNLDGSTTPTGSATTEEDALFDQVSESYRRDRQESTTTYLEITSADGPGMLVTFWDETEQTYESKITDHYDAHLTTTKNIFTT